MKKLLICLLAISLLTGTVSITAFAETKKYDCIYYGKFPQSEFSVNDNIKTTLIENGKTGVSFFIDRRQYPWGNRDYYFTYNGTTYYLLHNEEKAKYYLYEPIKWIVLKRQGNRAFLISDKILTSFEYYSWDRMTDAYYYDTKEKYITWEESVIRELLNDNFRKAIQSVSSFNPLLTDTIINFPDGEPSKKVHDYISLITKEDLDTYWGVDNKIGKRAFPTDYASLLSDNCYYIFKDTQANSRLLDGPDWTLYTKCNVDYINNNGDLLTKNFLHAFGVRPTMWVDLSEIDYENAGTYYSDGTYDELPYNNNLGIIAKAKITSAKRISKKRIKVKIQKCTNAKKFEVKYATNSKFTKAKTINTSKKTAYIKKVKKNKKYYIRIRGYNGSVYGNWSKTKTVKKVKKKK